MKTFIETQGLKPINWNKRIKELDKLFSKLTLRQRRYFNCELDGRDEQVAYLMKNGYTEAKANSIYDTYKIYAGDSMNWVTCACGNQCDKLPRDDYNTPDDPKLSSLGGDFANAITTINTGVATRLLAKIEIRSNELLNKMQEEELDMLQDLATQFSDALTKFEQNWN